MEVDWNILAAESSMERCRNPQEAMMLFCFRPEESSKTMNFNCRRGRPVYTRRELPGRREWSGALLARFKSTLARGNHSLECKMNTILPLVEVKRLMKTRRPYLYRSHPSNGSGEM